MIHDLEAYYPAKNRPECRQDDPVLSACTYAIFLYGFCCPHPGPVDRQVGNTDA